MSDRSKIKSRFAGNTERENLNIVAVFDDRARSGGSILGCERLLALMDKAREHLFDVIIVEALDRLSRDMEDLAGIHKRLSFLGIEIRAVHEGVDPDSEPSSMMKSNAALDCATSSN